MSKFCESRIKSVVLDTTHTHTLVPSVYERTTGLPCKATQSNNIKQALFITFVQSPPFHALVYFILLSEFIIMVCPYKLTTGLITAALSIFYVSTTMAEANDEFSKSSQKNKSQKTPMSPVRRMLVITVLVLFHADLFTTGYVRMGVKHLWENVVMVKA